MLSLTRRGFVALLGIAPAAAHAAPDLRVSMPQEALVLLRTRVNGEQYYQARASANTLRKGAVLRLQREPENAFDRRAIEVFDADGRKLGYVPRRDNPAVARMMDAGERMQARVSRVDTRFLEIGITVEWLRA